MAGSDVRKNLELLEELGFMKSAMADLHTIFFYAGGCVYASAIIDGETPRQAPHEAFKNLVSKVIREAIDEAKDRLEARIGEPKKKRAS